MELLITKSDESWMAAQCKLIDFIAEAEGGVKIVATDSKGAGKWGMARLWRSWMSITADFMANNGVTMPLMTKSDGTTYGTRRFRSNDAHELFTAQWLGVNERGERLSWRKSEGDNVADKGQRFMAMVKHQQWCIEKGINLPKPRNSEFNELEEAQNS